MQYSLEGLLQFSNDLSGYERELKNINDGIRDIRNTVARANIDGDVSESLTMIVRHIDKDMEQLNQISHSVHKLSEAATTIGGMYRSCENHIGEFADGENIYRATVNSSLMDLKHFYTFVTKWNLKI